MNQAQKRKEKKQTIKWHEDIRERANYTCEVCGTEYGENLKEYLCGHHILGKKSHPELKYDLNNGICVDVKCHNKIHTGEIILNNNK